MVEILQTDAENKLSSLIKSYKIKLLAYYLHFEASERKLPQEFKNAIKEKYGQEKILPAIDWTQTLGELADSDILDEEIKKYLESKNYIQESFLLPKDRLKNMLWNDAREEGKKILSKFNS